MQAIEASQAQDGPSAILTFSSKVAYSSERTEIDKVHVIEISILQVEIVRKCGMRTQSKPFVLRVLSDKTASPLDSTGIVCMMKETHAVFELTRRVAA